MLYQSERFFFSLGLMKREREKSPHENGNSPGSQRLFHSCSRCFHSLLVSREQVKEKDSLNSFTNLVTTYTYKCCESSECISYLLYTHKLHGYKVHMNRKQVYISSHFFTSILSMSVGSDFTQTLTLISVNGNYQVCSTATFEIYTHF